MKRAIAIIALLLTVWLLWPKHSAAENEAAVSVSSQKQSFAALEVSAVDFRKSILRICPDAFLEGDPELWLEQSENEKYLRVGGREISAMTINQIFLLGSEAFELCWTGENFLFEINGIDKAYSEA